MQKGASGNVSVHIDASPDVVYDVVSDITRMGEWSPETIKCEWIDGASGPAVGAKFKGTNKRGIAKWSTKPTVITADGHAFAFDVGTDTRWTYRVEPDGDGTKLSESFEMLRDIRWYYALAERWMMGVKDRQADLENGMTQTLQRVKRVVEADAPKA